MALKGCLWHIKKEKGQVKTFKLLSYGCAKNSSTKINSMLSLVNPYWIPRNINSLEFGARRLRNVGILSYKRRPLGSDESFGAAKCLALYEQHLELDRGTKGRIIFFNWSKSSPEIVFLTVLCSQCLILTIFVADLLYSKSTFCWVCSGIACLIMGFLGK